MKITTNKQTIKFQPVTISMTFESQEELDAMGSLFNTGVVINDYLIEIGGFRNRLYESFRDAGANIAKTSYVMNRLKSHPAVRGY
jgi:hypothetical protein